MDLNFGNYIYLTPYDEKPITHEDLRKRAIQWLTNTKHCGVVLSEICTSSCEVPDAIGWQRDTSILVECKISRSDFRCDRNKDHVRLERGVGQFRYILCPKGLLTAEDVNGCDYGLLEWGGGNVRVVVEASLRAARREDEIIMLVSALRRVHAREFLVIVPFGSQV